MIQLHETVHNVITLFQLSILATFIKSLANNLSDVCVSVTTINLLLST